MSKDSDNKIREDTIRKAHELADSAKEHFYIDPGTGMYVFTRTGLLARGKCCGTRCRHCPYGYENVKPD